MQPREQRTGIPLPSLMGRSNRAQPVRRLSGRECDLAGYAAPLVLSQQQVRWLFGPWRDTGLYILEQHPKGVVWQGSRKDLDRLGIDVDNRID